jgi:hypothetical protein
VTEARVRLHVNTSGVGQYEYLHEVDFHHAGETLTLLTPTESAVSPAWVEGELWGPGATVAVSVDGVAGSSTRVGALRWYADDAPAGPAGVHLKAEGPTAIEAKAVQGGSALQTRSQSITWTRTDLAGKQATTSVVKLRAGSALLLTASGAAGAALEIDANGDGANEFTGEAGQAFACAYEAAGTFVAKARVAGVEVGSLTVQAVGVTVTPFKGLVNLECRKVVPVVPAGAAGSLTVEALEPAKAQVVKTEAAAATASAPAGLRVYWKPLQQTTTTLALRLGGSLGPVLGTAGTQVGTLGFITTAKLPVLKSFANKDALVAGAMRMTPLISGISVRLFLFTGGAVFEDGSIATWVPSSAFDAGGQSNYYIMTSNASKVGCHATDVVEE